MFTGCVQTTFLDRKFHTSFSSQDDWNEGYTLDNNYLNTFIDGSKLDNKLRGSVFYEELNIHYSVYQAKVAAL